VFECRLPSHRKDLLIIEANRRGAVYPIHLGDAKRGHEQRLGLVISIEQDAWSTVTVLPTSTSAQASVFRLKSSSPDERPKS